MAFSITQFQGAMKFGGARPSLFEVRLTNPVAGFGDSQVPFMCRAAEIPSAEVNPLPITYFGRPVKFAGNRTFPDWTITLYNDEDFIIRDGLEKWSASINTFEGNVRDIGNGNPLAYKSDAQVIHYGKTGSVLREYRMIGIFPISISPIALAWDSEQVEEYSVTFSIDYWEVDGGASSALGSAAAQVF